jgi:riboflavin biosynthesis pyrimidine reductase
VTRRTPESVAALPENILDVELLWALLLSLVQQARRGHALTSAAGFGLVRGGWRQVPLEEASCIVDPLARPGRQIEVRRSLVVHPEVRALCELYLPLVIGERAAELAVGHFGPDEEDGANEARAVPEAGQAERLHTHRMRALFDAVILGVRTVLWDDPQLTTRLVPGPHPTRVILDPHGRLESFRARRVLTESIAPTIVCVDPSLLPRRRGRGHVDYLGVPHGPEGFHGRALFHALRARFGLKRLFVAGGRTTISRFLAQGLLDRVQVSVAPLVLGPGSPLRLSPPNMFKETFAPSCRQLRLGAATFFDFDLLAQPATSLV